MDLNLFLGLYILKEEDEFGDIFKSIYQLNIKENGGLYLTIIDGPNEGVILDNITYEILDEYFMSISSFLENAEYVGKNVARIPVETESEMDLNFTGYIKEFTGEPSDIQDLLTFKKQLMLYVYNYNVLMYYDENCYEIAQALSGDLEETESVRGLFFLNNEYVSSKWMAIEDCSGVFENRQQILLDFYTLDTVKSKRMILN